MINLKILAAIIYKDLLDALKNKTIFFAVFTPILLSLIFSLAFSKKDLRLPKVICFSEDLGFYKFIKDSKIFDLEQALKKEKAKNLVRLGKFNAAIILEGELNKINSKIQLILDNSSPKQAALVELSLNEIIRNFLGEKKPVNLEVQRLYKSSKDPRKTLLPSWLLFAILGSFMIVSASFLEEKEKKTLHAILISPASLLEIILGKIFLGLFLTLISTFLILILNGGMTGNLLNLFLIILLGSFYFCIVGIFISLLASNQGASNTLGSLLYLLFFMPVVLADTSRAMFNIAKFLPSFYILDGLSKALILNFGIGALKFHYLFLFLASLLLLGGNFLILRRQEI